MQVMTELLVKKFEEIQGRTLSVIDQLTDDELNWRPNDSSNSISNLVIHIQGNVNERILRGIHHAEIVRNREEEFEAMKKTKNELLAITKDTYKTVIETIQSMQEETWRSTQLVRGKERTNLYILLQCAAHFSEHLGQMMYIAKMLKNFDYVSTSIPSKKAK
ncbi:DUF1572 domain-containing protein [Paenibacillus nanensis]|uniref:DUF1572 domain-containing protein n=1 Tax=Paenibacillus nanensis TaxID=393251 RepID=A0A3A1V501_9BACL|nr:DinB family protein [Paenibacillus nanensis]RIX53693.1 DUF1572 domain-containing protein [Paenibacillus nanensis]